MDQIGAKTLKMLPNMIKICMQTVKTAIKKLSDTLEKTHASFPISTVRIEMQKSAQYK